ncbi:MAG: PrsW family intramembrane metalloprotease [Streptosporangiaceae bacterium]|nr:PrsW family intramembrane metalloprotease [Streptosporangiaceae bacterium]MBV9854703.1 PrsW family intramembrane metalloprotease [Streptosporangiaceae bacterium]
MAAPAPEPVLDVRRFGRTPVGFIVTLASCSLVALIALVIVVRGGPVPALTGLALALLPVPQVHAAVLYLDRLDPAPRALLAVMFGAGAGVAALTALAGRALHTGVITVPELGPQAGRVAGVTATAAIGGAVVAESLKGAVLLALFGARRHEIDGVHDGVVYASMTALGFALIANVYAYAEAERDGFGALASAFARRGILGPLWDPLFSSMIGIGIAYAAMRRGGRGYWAIAAGWVAAVALDALWNGSVAAGPTRLAVVYLVLAGALAVVAGLVAADRRRIVGLIKRFLPGYAASGAVTEPDVTMLASMRWRRAGRQWARLHRGHTGLRAMSEYQLAATALALAANRDSLGLIAPEVFAARRENALGLMRAAVDVLRAGRAPLRSPPWERNGRSVFAKDA